MLPNHFISFSFFENSPGILMVGTRSSEFQSIVGGKKSLVRVVVTVTVCSAQPIGTIGQEERSSSKDIGCFGLYRYQLVLQGTSYIKAGGRPKQVLELDGKEYFLLTYELHTFSEKDMGTLPCALVVFRFPEYSATSDLNGRQGLFLILESLFSVQRIKFYALDVSRICYYLFQQESKPPTDPSTSITESKGSANRETFLFKGLALVSPVMTTAGRDDRLTSAAQQPV